MAAAPVDLEGGKFDPGVFLHGDEHVAGLIGHGFEGSADDMTAINPAAETDYDAAGIRIPVWGAEPGEGGNQIATVGVGDALGNRFAFGGG